MYRLLSKRLPNLCVFHSQNCRRCKTSVANLATMIFFTRSCISYMAEKYHLPQYLLTQFPVTALQVVSPRLRISSTILSLGSHSPPGRSHLPLGLPATWWQLAITLLLLRPPAPPESQVMRWLWFPEPSPGRWNAIFHCHRYDQIIYTWSKCLKGKKTKICSTKMILG